MTSPLCVATGGWCRRVFHYRPPTPMYRNSPPLCTIVLQIPSLMPLKMRKVQAGRSARDGTGRGAEPEPEEPQAPVLPTGLSLDARQVIIQHVDTVHVYTQLPAGEMAP